MKWWLHKLICISFIATFLVQAVVPCCALNGFCDNAVHRTQTTCICSDNFKCSIRNKSVRDHSDIYRVYRNPSPSKKTPPPPCPFCTGTANMARVATTEIELRLANTSLTDDRDAVRPPSYDLQTRKNLCTHTAFIRLFSIVIILEKWLV